MTDSTSHPDAFVTVIVGAAEPPSVADDRVVTANRALPWQEVQWDHPGSLLSFATVSATNRITVGAQAAADRSPRSSIGWLASPS
jgi:hypothetical protein